MFSQGSDSSIEARFEVERLKQRERLLAMARGDGSLLGRPSLFGIFIAVLLFVTIMFYATHQGLVLMLLVLAVQLAHSASITYSQRRIDALLKLLDLAQAR